MRRRRAAVAVVASVTAAGVLGGVLLTGSREPAAEPPRPVQQPSPSPEAPRFELVVDLRKIRGRAVEGTVGGRRLGKPAERIRRTLTELYSIGFVDPERWRGGRFPELLNLFAAETRREARRDLGKLTLGRTSEELDAVRPRRARLDVRFVVNANRRPVVAVADLNFAGVGMSEDAEVSIRHRGRFVLRPSEGRWRVVAYRVRGRVPSPAEVRREVSRARATPRLSTGKPFFVLVIGSDARRGQSVTRSRADAIQIVAVNPKRRAVSIVGIPRDSYVPIPGVGTQKINAALVHGGPALMVRTVEQLTGIPFDGYVLTGFAGFKRLVSGIGGIEVNIPYRMADRNSGAYFQPGKKKLKGGEALAFARNRYDAPGGDFGRSMNQGRLIVASLRKLRAELDRDPAAALRWLLVGARHLHTDLSVADMAELLLAARWIEPRRVENTVVAGTGTSVGGASVVRLGPAAHAVFADLRKNGVLGG